MAVFEIPENPEYIEDIRKFETNDPGHADVFNSVVQDLVNNDAFLKRKAEQHDEKLAWFWNCGNRKTDTEKSVDAEGFRLFQGVRIVIRFQSGNTAADFTMNVNGTGNIPVRYRGVPVPADYIRVGHMIEFVYYENCWNVVGDLTQAQVDALETRLNDLTPADIGALPSSGNAVSASKWNTARKINGMSIDGTADRTNYGVCSTSGSTTAKTVSCTGFSLITGAEITVKFNNTNTASNPTLNVNSTGAKAIYYKGKAVPSGYILSGGTYTFRYNGTQWELVGDVTQKQVDLLKADSMKLDEDVQSLQKKSDGLNDLFDLMFEGLSDKLQGSDLSPVNGMIWGYAPEGSSKMHYDAGAVDMNETVQCAEITVEPGRIYKVVTYVGEDYINSVIPIQETDISYCLIELPKEWKAGKIVAVFKASETTKRILINRVGSNEDIVVYRLRL